MKQILIIFNIIVLAGCADREPERTGLEGNPLPDFNLLLSDSITYFNTSHIPSGKPFVLIYFSPVCSFSKAQTTEIIKKMSKLKNMQFYFVTSFPLSAMKAYTEEFKLSDYSNILIGMDTGHFVADYFETPGVPYMAIYGKDRKLKKSFIGKVNSMQIKKIAAE